jgi:hypothetical protein
MPYFSICAIFRNEAPYLREWMEFHKLVGTERFFLYDNASTDGSRATLEPYVASGLAVVRDWPHFPGQLSAYADCIERHRDDSRWIAFIDLDEFLFSPTGRPIGELLPDFEEWPAVGVNWANFGTSGHLEKPGALVIESYLMRVRNPRARRTIKSIVDPRRVTGCDNPHFFEYRDGVAVDELKRPIEGPDFARTESPSWSLLRVNHYWTKSEQEFREKIVATRSDTGEPRAPVEPRHGDVVDEAILIYLPALREALGAEP